MDISVIMIDGGFRERAFSAEYLGRQDFPGDRYEIIWVDFYDKIHEQVRQNKKIKALTLNNAPGTTYHSSYCFNKGIEMAKGELLVIPDADQVMAPDFLSKLWKIHSGYDKLVVYPYRYDEIKKGMLSSFDLEELEKKCKLINPVNYGGCLSVRKKWMLEINGYEQHRIFESGFHANGLDVYTRFKNYGLAIMWAPDIRMYHPWHTNTLMPSDQYIIQREFVAWRQKNVEYLAIEGIDKQKNSAAFHEAIFMKDFSAKRKSLAARIWKRLPGNDH